MKKEKYAVVFAIFLAVAYTITGCTVLPTEAELRGDKSSSESTVNEKEGTVSTYGSNDHAGIIARYIDHVLDDFLSSSSTEDLEVSD